MSKMRFDALAESHKRANILIDETGKRSDLFAKNVFNESKMLQFLTTDAFEKVKSAIFSGSKIDRKIADQVAEGMKAWALSMGATHYTHWFQPLTGATAEKHDAFFDLLPDGRAAFVYKTTLCIPTIFVSYTGEALDNKAPLLRALHAVDEAATGVAQYFDKNVRKVNATLGWEQEYFLIDKALAQSRPDILMTGRTLVGNSAAKGQQLDDHYFGVIPSRVLSFMSELEKVCTQLGIPVKTRHNEVAPNQFELAPVFEEANLSVDHNLLLMDVMDEIADKHDFKVLFHEKPFAGINGSGKHNNC